MDNKSLQEVLKTAGFYAGKIDGIIGRKSAAAIEKYLDKEASSSSWKRWGLGRRKVAVAQLVYKSLDIEVGAIDGLIGPQTRYAHETWLHLSRTGKKPESWRDDVPETKKPKPVKNNWPTQRGVPRFFGKPGSNQVSLTIPYPMRIAWNKRQTITRFSCHAKVKDSMERVLVQVKEHYGLEEIKRLRLDLFGGCLNVRKMRGGSRWSMHAWGIAIDIDPERNQLRWGRDRATLDNPEYDAWWEAWEAEGWTSLGRARNFDWMHSQAARI